MIWEGIGHFYDCLEEAEEHGLVVGLMEKPRRDGKNKQRPRVEKDEPLETDACWVNEMRSI